MPRRLALFLVAGALAAAPAMARTDRPVPERTVYPAARTHLALTLYQNATALVHDRRSVILGKGLSRLVWEGVAQQTRTTTGILSGTGLSVRNQAFDVDGASGQRLLNAAVGTDVWLFWPGAGGDNPVRARVISAGADPVFDVGGKVVAGRPARIQYESLPAGMRARPVFTATIDSARPGRRDVDLSYMTGGLGWQADYVAEVAPHQDHILLSGWTTLTNDSGMDYPDARLSIVAGTPNRAESASPMVAAAVAAPTDRTILGLYHVFTLPYRVTLRNGQRTQAVLLPATRVKVQRELVLNPLPVYAWRSRFGETPRQHPISTLLLDNTAANGLGRPLPGGRVRLYRRTRSGTPLFIGEDRVPATPVGQSVRIPVGEAFDVTARRVQTDFEHVSTNVSEAAYEVRLSNASAKPVQVTVREAFGGDWLVLVENMPHHRDSALSASWTVTVPAKGRTVLRYRVRVRS
jgi:hypothetical protein